MDSVHPSHTYDPEADTAARQIRRTMTIACGYKDGAALISPANPIAHAFARPFDGVRPGLIDWALCVDECPSCGGVHFHDVEGGPPLDMPFDIPTRSAGLHPAPCSPWTFWERERSSDGNGSAFRLGTRTVILPDYEIRVDKMPPLVECAHIPENAHMLLMMTLPTNAGSLALDSEVY